jgi:hypothetical protein
VITFPLDKPAPLPMTLQQCGEDRTAEDALNDIFYLFQTNSLTSISLLIFIDPFHASGVNFQGPLGTNRLFLSLLRGYSPCSHGWTQHCHWKIKSEVHDWAALTHIVPTSSEARLYIFYYNFLGYIHYTGWIQSDNSNLAYIVYLLDHPHCLSP